MSTAFRRAVWVIVAGAAAAPFGVAAQPTAPRARLVQEMRIDGVKEDVSQIGFVLVGARGQIVFSETQDYRLRFYDSAGRHLGNFGRKGGGPGEFVGSTNMTPAQALLDGGMIGDTVWVYDRGARRTTYLDRPEHLLRSVAMPAAIPTAMGGGPRVGRTAVRKLLAFSPLAVYPDGRMLGRASFGTAVPMVRSDGSSTLMQKTDAPEYVVLLRTGEQWRSIAVQPQDDGFLTVVRNGGLRSWGLSVPFAANALQATAQDGSRIAFLTTNASSAKTDFTITVIGANGDTLLSRTHPFTGNWIPASVRDSAVNAQMRTYKTPPRGGRAPDAPPDVVSELEQKLRASMPQAAAPIRGLLVGLDNSIWLTLQPTAEGRSWLALDERGNPWRTVQLPPTARLARASRAALWVVEYDDDGVPSLVRYRLESGGRGPLPRP